MRASAARCCWPPESSRSAALQSGQSKALDQALHGRLPRCAVFSRRTGEDVLLDRHVRKQSVMLEQIAHPPLLRRKVDPLCAVKKDAVVQDNAPAVRPLDSGDTAQGHALARARRTQQSQSFARRFELRAQSESIQPLLYLNTKLHRRTPRFSRCSSRLTASRTTAEMARLTITHRNASASSPVRQS